MSFKDRFKRLEVVSLLARGASLHCSCRAARSSPKAPLQVACAFSKASPAAHAASQKQRGKTS